MNINRKGINFKTIGYLIIFSTTILLLLWFFQILFLRVFYERYQVKNMSKMANKIMKIDNNDFIDSLEAIAYQNNICIELDNNNEIIGFNLKMPTCILNNKTLVNRYKYELLESKKKVSTLKLVNRENEVKGLLSAIKKDNNIIYTYTNLQDVNTTSIILRNQLIYITLLAIILSSLLALFISKRLTKPIVDITKKAKDLGKKDHIIFEKNGITEIDDLATTLNFAQEEITKVDELRRDLMANVSHDLKTPLTMIKAYAEMIKDFSYKDDKKRNEHLDIIIDETDRLNILVNDILLLAKSQEEVEQLNIEEYDLIKEIKKIIKRYEIIKETEDYKIILKSPKKVIVKADKNKINQVIYNLINNAINYTGKDKKVEVIISEEENKYVISINDTGKGIKEEDIEHIWQKYYKNEKNHQRNVIGTGLGLSIVKAILDHHNFVYGVKSKKNKGTSFYFEILK